MLALIHEGYYIGSLVGNMREVRLECYVPEKIKIQLKNEGYRILEPCSYGKITREIL